MNRDASLTAGARATGRARAGQLVRHWRRRRGLSQLELSARTGISTRHLSCVETGRATASRQLLRFLATELDLPLRSRNALLLAAGYAPDIGDTPLDAAAMEPMLAALSRLLHIHEPYPAVVVDGRWNLVSRNASAMALTAGTAVAFADGPINVLRNVLHPDGLASRIANLAEWSAHLLRRLHRRIEQSGDPALIDLEREVSKYPGIGDPYTLPAEPELFVPLRIRYRGTEIRLFNTLTTFAAPLDATLSDLVLETFHPADPGTAAIFEQAAAERTRPTPEKHH